MDFTFSPEADDAAALAAAILTDHTQPERLAEVEADGNRFDPVLWKALSDAFDGADLGFVELCRVLVEVGRRVAPVPLATDSVARMFLAEQGATIAADVLSCAIAEEHEHAPAVPTTTATPVGDEYVLTGTKYLVPAATVATMFLVPATTPSGTAVFLVDPDTRGLRVQEQHLSDGDVVGLLELDEVRVAAERRVGD